MNKITSVICVKKNTFKSIFFLLNVNFLNIFKNQFNQLIYYDKVNETVVELDSLNF
jgi:hypothetical protein